MCFEFFNISKFIETLNKSCNYLILRNFENLQDEKFLLDGHPDIDLLVENPEAVVDALGAKPSHSDDKYGDRVHFYVLIDGVKVSLDLRSPGDGYYCKKWEEDMLANRILTNGFYTPSPKDYFYSLLYHALFQKKNISKDYIERLSAMAKDLGIDLDDFDQKRWVTVLEQFMRQKGYAYTYCTDYHVPLYHRWIDKKLFQKNWRLAFRHFRYDTKLRLIDLAVKFKHKFLRH